MILQLKNSLSWIIREFLMFLIVGLRPLLGPPARCCYAVSCTDFAVFQLQNEPLLKAIWAITKRLLSCHPFHRHKKLIAPK